MGAQVARPDTDTVVLVGDGGFMFTVQELVTAVELGLSLPVVVVGNGGYGAIRDQMVERGIAPLGVDLAIPDLAALGGACGARGATVDDPAALTREVAAALTVRTPTLIHVRV